MAHGQTFKTNLYRKAEAVKPTATSVQNKVKPLKVKMQRESGNLPAEYNSRILNEARYDENPIVVPSNTQHVSLNGAEIGNVVDALISENLIAYPDSKAPVRAVITRGPLKGSVFLGDATLEKNSKRIAIEFKKVRGGRNSEIYALSAVGLDALGTLGIEGEHHSGEAKFFGAEFLAAGAAAFTDATVDRSQNYLGQVVEAPSVSNASKKGLSSALSKTADRFSEKVRTAPEFVTVDGPVRIKILITDQLRIEN